MCECRKKCEAFFASCLFWFSLMKTPLKKLRFFQKLPWKSCSRWLPFRSTWHFFLQKYRGHRGLLSLISGYLRTNISIKFQNYRKYRFIRILLRDVSIPKLGATAPVLGIKKPSPLTITLNIGYNIFRHQVQVHRFSEWRVPYGN